MPAYLKIENVGVCPPEGFTVLGVSLADTSRLRQRRRLVRLERTFR